MAPQKEVVLKLTSMRYKKEGVSEEQFHEYGSKFHGPKAAVVQARHGAVRVAQISVYVRATEDMLAIVMDPDFQALLAGDDEVVDAERGTVTAGWEEVYVEDGKVVNVENGESLYPPFTECVKAGNTSQRTETKETINF